MSVIYRLGEDVAEMDRQIERLTGTIEELEARIVETRRKRDDVRFHRVEALAAINALESIGFRVERDTDGLVTVSVDPPKAPA